MSASARKAHAHSEKRFEEGQKISIHYSASRILNGNGRGHILESDGFEL